MYFIPSTKFVGLDIIRLPAIVTVNRFPKEASVAIVAPSVSALTPEVKAVEAVIIAAVIVPVKVGEAVGALAARSVVRLVTSASAIVAHAGAAETLPVPVWLRYCLADVVL